MCVLAYSANKQYNGAFMDLVTKRTNWSDIKQSIKALNPSFYHHLESANPSDDLPLFITEYPYGHHIPNALITMVLDKQIEQYVDHIRQPMPWKILSPGDFVSTESNASINGYPSNILTTISGIKDIHLLSLHSTTQDFYQLRRKYDIPAQLSPENPNNHFAIFKHLIEKENISWHSSILTFGDEWRKNIEQDKQWWPFRKYLIEEAMKTNQETRFSPFLDFAIQDITCRMNIKLKRLVLDTIKQLLLVATGEIPGFRPSTTNDGFPIQEVCETLKHASRELLSDPVFMQAAMITPNDFIYHSVTYNAASSNDSKFNPNTLLNDVYLHIKDYLSQFKTHTLTQNTIYGTLHDHLNIIPCSTRGSDKLNIKKCIELYDLDPSFAYSRNKLGCHSRYGAPINAQFCKGFFGMRLSNPPSN